MQTGKGPFRPPQPSAMFRFAEPTPGYLAFAGAYKKSANVLAEHFTDDMTETLPAPLVFLFRHALEVYLKGILIEYGADVGCTKETVLKRGHDLIKHLGELDTVAAEVGHTLSAELREYVTYMNEFDPDSQHWRYPEVKKNKGMLLTPSRGTEEINVPHFVASSNHAFDELDQICERLWNEEYKRILTDAGIDIYVDEQTGDVKPGFYDDPANDSL